MKYKHIEASREARLWLGQVIIPAVTTVGMAMSIPEVRNTVKTKYTNIKQKFKRD